MAMPAPAGTGGTAASAIRKTGAETGIILTQQREDPWRALAGTVGKTDLWRYGK